MYNHHNAVMNYHLCVIAVSVNNNDVRTSSQGDTPTNTLQLGTLNNCCYTHKAQNMGWSRYY